MAESNSIFYERLKSLCRDRGISLSNIGDEAHINISSATLTRWRDGVTPRNATLKALADFFEVDVAYLVGEEAPPVKNPFEKIDDFLPLTAQEAQLLKMFRSASELGKMRIISQIVKIWEQDQ